MSEAFVSCFKFHYPKQQLYSPKLGYSIWNPISCFTGEKPGGFKSCAPPSKHSCCCVEHSSCLNYFLRTGRCRIVRGYPLAWTAAWAPASLGFHQHVFIPGFTPVQIANPIILFPLKNLRFLYLSCKFTRAGTALPSLYSIIFKGRQSSLQVLLHITKYSSS